MYKRLHLTCNHIHKNTRVRTHDNMLPSISFGEIRQNSQYQKQGARLSHVGVGLRWVGTIAEQRSGSYIVQMVKFDL